MSAPWPALLPFTALFDFSGNPCLTLTGGFTGDGLPLSLQIVGRQAASERHERHLKL